MIWNDAGGDDFPLVRKITITSPPSSSPLRSTVDGGSSFSPQAVQNQFVHGDFPRIPPVLSVSSRVFNCLKRCMVVGFTICLLSAPYAAGEKWLSSAFGEFDQLLSWLPLTSGSLHSGTFLSKKPECDDLGLCCQFCQSNMIKPQHDAEKLPRFDGTYLVMNI